MLRRNRQSFTLIELLVVIAIIAILASMLMPALSKARAKSQAIKCMGNVKTLTTATLLYADAMKEWFPVAHDNQWNRLSAGSPIHWRQFWSWHMMLLNWKFLDTRKAVDCPSTVTDASRFRTQVGHEGSTNELWRATDYGWNARGYHNNANAAGGQGIGMGKRRRLNHQGNAVTDHHGGHVRASEIKDPDNMLMIGDNRTINNEHWIGNASEAWSRRNHATSQWQQFVPMRHSRGFNAGFMDGHAAYIDWYEAVPSGRHSMWTRAQD